MAAILGLRGTGDFTSDERPKNWREMILHLFPNGEAPLTAMLSMLRSEGTDDPEYNWWEKRLPTQRLIANGGETDVATAIDVDSGALGLTKGTILLVESTNELIRVDADPTVDTAIPTVLRSYGAVTAAAFADDAALVVIGNVNDEGASTRTARSEAPTKKFNYTEIFRTPMYLTRTARRTKLRWDLAGPYREAKREALQLHSIEMEKAFIFGEPVEVAGYNGKPQRMTGGVINSIVTNKDTVAYGGTVGLTATFGVDGTLSETELDALCEQIFRYGHNEKLVLCGSTFLGAISSIGKRNGTLQMVPQDRTYGIKIVEYMSAFGSLMLRNHPLFSQHPVWRGNALVLDVDNLVYRPLDDTRLVKNRQENGADASLDEFLTEAGLEVHFEETHAYITGVTGPDLA